MAKNPFTVLGVSETATDDEIRAAYRRLAKQYHPDLNPNDPVAESKMNDINVAYDQIKTAEKRAEYRSFERTQSTYQQSTYQSNPWQTYYRTGQGYYGGSYTGNQQSGGNEPPFGWGSIFEEQQNRRAYTARHRRVRLIYLLILGLMLYFMTRCVVTNLFYTCASFLTGESTPYSRISSEIDYTIETGVSYEV